MNFKKLLAYYSIHLLYMVDATRASVFCLWLRWML